MLHETDELIERNPAVFAAGDSVPVQRAAVEPFTDGSGSDVTDFCHLAGGQYVFDLCSAHGIFSTVDTISIG
jgi:hypothetical protein